MNGPRAHCSSLATQRLRQGVVVAWTAVVWLFAECALAQPTSSGVAESDEPAEACFPSCRAGYLCHQGQCISACNPPCGAGEVCEDGGVCRLMEAAPPPRASEPSTARTDASNTSSPERPESAAPANSPAPRGTVPQPPVLPPAKDPPGGTNVHINALGLLQFGVIPRVEFGGATTLLLGAHFFNTGILSYSVIPGDSSADTFSFGIGGNVGVRRYFHPDGGQAGAYLGGFLELAYIKTVDESDDMAEYHRNLLIPAVDAGYRWVWGKFLLDLGGIVGAAIVTGAEDRPVGPNGCRYSDSCLEEADTTIFGMGTLNVGFFL